MFNSVIRLSNQLNSDGEAISVSLLMSRIPVADRDIQRQRRI
ncbi:hypothetical protein [Photorhabdus sp. RW14-46]|nr:hypothetical protein [Photorhabdus sp. RW14-46]